MSKILVLLASVASISYGAQTVQVEQSFTLDPQWEGKNNRPGPEDCVDKVQDFGFSETSHAGGEEGEIGGLVSRSLTKASYALVIPQRTLDNHLSSSGRFAVTQSNGGSGVLIGWFNAHSNGWRTPNSLAFRIDGEQDCFRVFFEYGTRSRRTGGGQTFEGAYQTTKTPMFPADGSTHTWSLTYLPEDAEGKGRITFVLDGNTYTADLEPGHKEDGAAFNRFGLLNQQISGNGLTIWLDDLRVDGSDFSFNHDPAWEGVGNRCSFRDCKIRPIHNVGYSMTQHAGGELGEMGGTVWRIESTRPQNNFTYAAKVGRLSMHDSLHAEGKLCLALGSADSAVLLGWFNSLTPIGAPPINFLGAFIEGPSRIGHYFRPMVCSSEGITAVPESGPVVPSDSSKHVWSIHYDPKANQGLGALIVGFDQETCELAIPQQLRKGNAVFDRFGLLSWNRGGNCVDMYLDDIQFTAQEESMTKDEGSDTRDVYELGRDKFLFLDEFLLDRAQGAHLDVNPPGNVQLVMVADKPWERGGITSYGNALWDPMVEEFKLYYVPVAWDAAPGWCLALAVSKDGVRWDKPNLGAVEWKGSTENNIVIWAQREGTVFIDPNAKEESRYAFISSDPNLGTRLFNSPDGIHFRMSGVPLSTLHSDSQISSFWNQDVGKYFHYPRRSRQGRAVGLVTTRTVDESWPDPESIPIVMSRDDLDPPGMDLYTNATERYSAFSYVAFPTPYYHHNEPESRSHLLAMTLAKGGKRNDGLIESQLATSRDGLHWTRYRTPYFPTGTYDGCEIQVAMAIPSCIVRDNQVIQYFMGYTFTHGDTQARCGDGGRVLGGVFRAEQRLDGFISLDFDYQGGEVVTNPLLFEGRHLVLNVNTSASGEGRVAVLDAKRSPIAGFGLDDCRIIHGNHYDTVVSWGKGKSDLTSLAGRPVCLAFQFRGSKLYSFQFRP